MSYLTYPLDSEWDFVAHLTFDIKAAVQNPGGD